MFTYFVGKPLGIIPTGLIVPYTAGSAPSGWSNFTAANNDYIIGAGSTYSPGSSGAGSGDFGSITVATAGDHESYITPIPSTATAGNKWRNNSLAGDHSHTGTVGAYTPPYQGCYLIKAGAGNTLFPANAVVWTYGVDKSNFASNIWANNYMFRGLSGHSTGGSNSLGSIVTSSDGDHGHGVTDSGDGSGSRASITIGAHSHTISIIMQNNMRQRALAAWRNASDNIPLTSYGPNIIGMYESLTPPDGWHLCNGSNGTPDMRDYFVKTTSLANSGVGSGNGTVSATTASAIAHGLHNHQDNNEDGGGSGTSYHWDDVQMPSHSALNDSKTWLPPYYALAFIMKG